MRSMEEQASTQTMAGPVEAPGTQPPVEPSTGATSQAVDEATTAKEPAKKAQGADSSKADGKAGLTAAERKRLMDLIKEDPEYAREFEVEVNRRAQRIADKRLKKAELQRAKDDPIAAQELVSREYQSLEEEEKQAQTALSARSQVRARLETLFREDADYRELASEVYKREGRQKIDERFMSDPEGFEAWLDREVWKLSAKREAERIARELAPEIAKGLAMSEVNEKLRSTPVPPSAAGVSASDEALLASVASMTLEEYRAKRQAIREAEERLLKARLGR